MRPSDENPQNLHLSRHILRETTKPEHRRELSKKGFVFSEVPLYSKAPERTHRTQAWGNANPEPQNTGICNLKISELTVWGHIA